MIAVWSELAVTMRVPSGLYAAENTLNRPVFCIRSGWVLVLDVGSVFERSRRARTRRVGLRFTPFDGHLP